MANFVKGGRSPLRDAVEGFADDYMTSEHHHPGYVLIPTVKFDAIRAALAADVVLTQEESFEPGTLPSVENDGVQFLGWTT